MKLSKDNKGITLVALVITIIILLILAGVAISSLMGSGLFNKAIESKDKAEIAQEVEQLKLAIYAVKADPAYSDSYRTSCLYELWPEAALLKSLDYLLLVLRAKGFDSDP